MAEQNRLLDEFLENSKRVRQEIAGNPHYISIIKEKLKKLNNEDNKWLYGNDAVFTGLFSGSDHFGLKIRDQDLAITEITANADLYCTDLPFSPFVLLVDGLDSVCVDSPQNFSGKIAYITKEFKDMQDVCFNQEEFKKSAHYQTLRNYMISRGYGEFPAEAYEVVCDDNSWVLLCLYQSSSRRWGIHDLDCLATLRNGLEIQDGANNGQGKFRRLNQIWRRVNTPEYTINLGK